MTTPAVDARARADMWVNFLNAAELGTVVQGHDLKVWQKRGKFMWQLVGSNGEYAAEDISWPVHVLRAGG